MPSLPLAPTTAVDEGLDASLFCWRFLDTFGITRRDIRIGATPGGQTSQ